DPFNQVVHLETSGPDREDPVEWSADRLLVDPELPAIRRPIPLLRPVIRGEFEENQRRNRLLPENVGATVFALEFWRNSGDIEPIGSLRPAQGRVGPFPVDAAILPDAEVPIGVDPAQDRQDAVGEQKALGML